MGNKGYNPTKALKETEEEVRRLRRELHMEHDGLLEDRYPHLAKAINKYEYKLRSQVFGVLESKSGGA